MKDRIAPLMLDELAQKKILLLDGAMGTEIQTFKLNEKDFRGQKFKNHPNDLFGNNDVLVLTKPDLVLDIHRSYLSAGSDIIETNTFTATSISQADYGLEGYARDLNCSAAVLACQAVSEAEMETPNKPRFVAGVLGPTNKTASISPEVNDPAYRDITFDELRASYAEAVGGLLDGGVDLLMVETIFDTLNAKAALFAIDDEFERRNQTLPIMISGTITDKSGRTLSGQTTEAFWYSVRHANPFSVGLNCALGASDLRQYIAELAQIADCYVSAYPNAGLPNAFGDYEETPEMTAGHLGEWAQAGLVNIVGGCCGTTPGHIKAISEIINNIKPRSVPDIQPRMRLAGLEPFEVSL